MIVLDDLDKKALDHFRGFVVKKDLVGIIKGGANVPAFVLEYLFFSTLQNKRIKVIISQLDSINNSNNE